MTMVEFTFFHYRVNQENSAVADKLRDAFVQTTFSYVTGSGN